MQPNLAVRSRQFFHVIHVIFNLLPCITLIYVLAVTVFDLTSIFPVFFSTVFSIITCAALLLVFIAALGFEPSIVDIGPDFLLISFSPFSFVVCSSLLYITAWHLLLCINICNALQPHVACGLFHLFNVLIPFNGISHVAPIVTLRSSLLVIPSASIFPTPDSDAASSAPTPETDIPSALPSLKPLPPEVWYEVAQDARCPIRTPKFITAAEWTPLRRRVQDLAWADLDTLGLEGFTHKRLTQLVRSFPNLTGLSLTTSLQHPDSHLLTLLRDVDEMEAIKRLSLGMLTFLTNLKIPRNHLGLLRRCPELRWLQLTARPTQFAQSSIRSITACLRLQELHFVGRMAFRIWHFQEVIRRLENLACLKMDFCREAQFSQLEVLEDRTVAARLKTLHVNFQSDIALETVGMAPQEVLLAAS
ncbi:hypothetical protein BGX23_010178 [Mortierella sp. AD031]|nr:hypothetical protein BGX23_010178 [Mortierella sp. AD031]